MALLLVKCNTLEAFVGFACRDTSTVPIDATWSSVNTSGLHFEIDGPGEHSIAQTNLHLCRKQRARSQLIGFKHTCQLPPQWTRRLRGLMLLALTRSGRISSSSMLIRFENAGLTMWNFGYARLGCVNLAALNENWAVFLRFFQVNTGWRINRMFPNVNSEDTFVVSKKPTILPTAVAPHTWCLSPPVGWGFEDGFCKTSASSQN